HQDLAGSGILVLGVDNLPAELPRDATMYFGKMLTPYVPPLLKTPFNAPFGEAALDRATITCRGVLTSPYRYISELRAQADARLKRVLLLGAGLVSAPVVETLCRLP